MSIHGIVQTKHTVYHTQNKFSYNRERSLHHAESNVWTRRSFWE